MIYAQTHINTNNIMVMMTHIINNTNNKVIMMMMTISTITINDYNNSMSKCPSIQCYFHCCFIFPYITMEIIVRQTMQ